jgi:hypothetical protein
MRSLALPFALVLAAAAPLRAQTVAEAGGESGAAPVAAVVPAPAAPAAPAPATPSPPARRPTTWRSGSGRRRPRP